jgi:DNA-binding PadR family transcriptional regulator
MYIPGMTVSTPLTPAVFAILLSLAGGDRHGYAMMKDARAPEGGGIAMGPGTLYGTLERLTRDNLVVETDTSDNERRRYYRLTDAGRVALEAELNRMESALAAARQRGLFPQGGRS